MGIICLICIIGIKDLKAWRSKIKKKKADTSHTIGEKCICFFV